MINFSNKSSGHIFVEQSKIKCRKFIYILSIFIKLFCVCRNISIFSNFSVLIIIGEFLYKCCKVNSYNITSAIIIIANYWIGTINGYFTILALISSTIMIFSLITMQNNRQSRYISVLGQWFKIYYFLQLAIFLVLVNVVHKLLLWEVMLVFTGHLLCMWLYFGVVDNSKKPSANCCDDDSSNREYCIKCQRSIPHRGQHCSICNRCSTIAQYHNVWINTCIDKCNRRMYFVLCLMAAITNIYQIHVSITSVCTPRMFSDWFLVIDDCRYIYSDVIYSWIFVSCVFNMIFTSLLLVTLLYEIVLISQNITHFEFENCISFPNCINKGFIYNWLEFLVWK